MDEENLRVAFICLVAFVRTWICINFHSVLINEYWAAVFSPAVSLFLLFEFIDERWFYAQRACNPYEKDFAAKHNVTIQDTGEKSKFAGHVRRSRSYVRRQRSHVYRSRSHVCRHVFMFLRFTVRHLNEDSA